MSHTTSLAREHRWIILDTGGRYVTLGRASDPTEEEIGAAEESLVANGLAGWLAVMEGSPYRSVTPSLMLVRPLGSPTVSFADASRICLDTMGYRHPGAGNE